jgi:hypothetical protein
MNLNKIIALFTILALAFTVVSIPSAAGEGVTREFKDVHVNMKANEVFNPEFVHDNETEAQSKRVMADYDDYGAVRANRRFVDVGTWTSGSLSGAMTIQGSVTFNIWFKDAAGNGGSDSDWIFDLEYNGAQAVHAEQSYSASSTTEAKEVTVSASVSEPINAASGDTFGISIQYSGWEDIDVYFDTIELDSGAMISTDSLVITSAGTSSAKFFDAWGLNWDQNGKYFCSLNYGGVVNQGNDETTIEDGGPAQVGNDTEEQVSYIKFKNIEKGTGTTVFVSISYGPNGTSEAWTLVAGGGGGGNPVDDEKEDDDTPVAMIGGGVIVVILIGVLVYLFVFKKGADEDEDEEGDEEDDDEDDEYGDDEDE